MEKNDIASINYFIYIGLDMNYATAATDEVSVRSLMDSTSLRYSADLHNLDWANIFDQAIPFVSNFRKGMILHACGRFSVNPVLILSKIIQDQDINLKYRNKSDEEFRSFINSFADSLSRYEQEFEAEPIKFETSSLEYSLNKVFENDNGMMRDLMVITDTLSNRYDIKNKRNGTNQIYQKNIFKRENEEEISLELPYHSTECWQLSATHLGAQESEFSAVRGGKPSAIDMSPYLFARWGVPFDFVNSSGEVHSSHSGYFRKHSDCSVEVTHDKSLYSTFYSHIVPNDIENNVFVESGESIGRIDLDPDTSNCKCDWSQKSFLCSTGPHMHLELRHNGSPASLDGRTISKLRIKAGLLPHDAYCSDPEDCTLATFEGRSCATYFTDETTEPNKVLCAVTKKESNIGNKKHYFLQMI